MPRSYPAEFRRKELDLVEAGHPVAEIAQQLGVTGQTIYNSRNQDLVDRGLRSGVSIAESVELAAARKRIREPAERSGWAELVPQVRAERFEVATLVTPSGYRPGRGQDVGADKLRG